MTKISIEEILEKENQVVIGSKTCLYATSISGVWFFTNQRPNILNRFMLRVVFGINWFVNKERGECGE